uniref:HTH CENPB-type domain-containing protein n=1 Tax=Globodera rostochiensis TaxID=31243 RepID=A0A914I1M4_GLORO
MDSICCVCKLKYQGSHQCSSCKMPCHAICGDAADEEGYGAQVVCFICKNKESGIAANDQNVGEKDEDEPQLHDDDDGILVDRKRYRHNDATKKLDAIEWAWKNSIKSAAKKFRVNRKSIQLWMKQEDKLKQQMNSGGGKRKRLDGGGRAVQHLNIDTTLADWIKEMRLNKKPVTRSIIKNKAAALFVDTDIKELSKEMIIKSFEVCGLATTSDGYGDDRINCFKPDGSIGARGIELLREFRGKKTMKDGRNDVEEAGLSEDENDVELGGVGDDDELFFQI